MKLKELEKIINDLTLGVNSDNIDFEVEFKIINSVFPTNDVILKNIVEVEVKEIREVKTSYKYTFSNTGMKRETLEVNPLIYKNIITFKL